MNNTVQAKFTAAQMKEMRQTLCLSNNDLDYVLHPVAVQMLGSGMDKTSVVSVLRDAAKRGLYLIATDKAASFGIEIPISDKARGTRVMKMVDTEAARFALKVVEGVQRTAKLAA